MPSLKTPLCDLLGVEVPIICAGMGPAAGVALAAAVSNAGGLGVLGCTTDSPEEIRAKIHQLRELTDRPFGVDLILPQNLSEEPLAEAEMGQAVPEEHRRFVESLKTRFGIDSSREPLTRPLEFCGTHLRGTGVREQVEVVIEERVPVFVSGLGSPGFMIPRAREQGMQVMAVVGSVRAARKVAADGVDAVIAQGHEGGGHTGRVGTFSLLPQVIDAVSPVPVIAAGGVADGRGLAAALAFGCQAVWVGTRFLATPEAVWEQWRKERIVSAHDESTVVTKCYSGKPCRVLRNAWVDAWDKGPVEPLPMPLQFALVDAAMREGADNPEVLIDLAGQIAGLVNEVVPAAEVVRSMVREAEEIINRMRSFASIKL